MSMSTLDALFAGAWGPLIIFCLRICDVSFSTLRIVLSVRNARWIVPVLAFFEVAIWITAAGTVIRHLSSPLHFFGYTTGFAAGTWVGLWIEQKLAFGWASLQILSRRSGAELARTLRELGYAVTEFAGAGGSERVDLVRSVLKRRALPAALAAIERCDPDACVMVEHPEVVRRGWLLAPQTLPMRGRATELRQDRLAPRVPKAKLASG
ncbi:MAG TPA: DUF5698 domain-containing protein [Longimicrobiales bacterium]